MTDDDQLMVRLGLPLTGGQLVHAAADLGAPVLVSVNALYRDRRWRRPSKALLAMDVALDSAGFVAMRHYGDFPWTMHEYLDIAQAYPWAWYAAMDLCCEPEIAGDRQRVLLRVNKTVHNLTLMCSFAADRGIRRPVPVLQGWEPEDYERCAHDMHGRVGPLPDLVGIGSVCRRSVRGVLAIVSHLDRVLPPNIKFHLFGVKSDAMVALRDHPRAESVDSMAWDFAARMEPGPNTMEKRTAAMRRWYAKQLLSLDHGASDEQLEFNLKGANHAR